MKITGKTNIPSTISSTPINPLPYSDPLHKPSRRKTQNSAAGVRLKREGAPAGKRSGTETPLLRWKVDDCGDRNEKSMPELGRRKPRGGREVVLSARKLAAGLWRLQPPELPNINGEECCSLPMKDRLRIQPGSDHVGVPVLPRKRDPTTSSGYVGGPRTGFLSKLEPSFHFSNSEMEGATKWDPAKCRIFKEVKRISGQSNHYINEQVSVVSAVAALEVELDQARTRINELETEQHSSKKKLEHFLKKLSEERAIWRSREHEKIRAVVDDIRSDLNRERKTRKRIEMVNSKLANELADVKLSAKRFMQEYEKEKKARELTEVVCNELAKEIGDDKAEFEELQRESMRFREEIEDERKMLQMAEVWREERVQMKLVDVKIAVEEKYSKMNKLVSDLEKFLRSKVDSVEEIRKGEILHKAANSININDITDFSYEPANPDIFSVFEDINFGGKEEDDESGWETVSRHEDCGSSYSPDGSDETGVSEISEVRSVSAQHLKKVASKSRMWKSFPSKGDVRQRSNGGGVVMSGDEWSSSEESVGNENPHVTRGIKGCIEWPRGGTTITQQQQKNNNLKAKLTEAKIESQKIQLRHVLKQKI